MDMKIFYDGETGIMMNYSIEVNQIRRADGITRKDYYIRSVLTSINEQETGLSLLSPGPKPGLSTEQIMFYVIVGGFIVLVGAVIVGIYRAPSDKEERSQ